VAPKPKPPAKPPVRPAAPPPPKPASPPPRPNPSKPPAPGKPPAPAKPPTPPAGKPRPPAGKPPKPPAGKPTPGPVVRGPGGAPKTKPPKPSGSAGPGQSWVYNAQSNSWQKKRNSIATPNRPTTGTVTSQPDGSTTVEDTPVGAGDEGGAAPAPPKTQAEIEADVRAAGESRVGLLDPTLEGKYTSETSGMGGLGFGLTKAGGGKATYADIFGAPGGAVDTKAFEIRDAQGRLVNRDLLGTDVFGAGGTGTDVSGTKLGQTIAEARRTAAREAEQRSSSGITGGGLRTAAGEQKTQREGADITGLLGQLTNLTTDIGQQRTQAFAGAQEDISAGDIGRFNPEVTPPRAGATTPAAPGAAGGRPSLTTGPKGTFNTEANKARSSGTPAQRIKKLNDLLGKYNVSPLQKKTIAQMIRDIQKRAKK